MADHRSPSGQVSLLLTLGESLSQHPSSSTALTVGVGIFHALQQPHCFDFFDLAAAFYQRDGIYISNLHLLRVCIDKCTFS